METLKDSKEAVNSCVRCKQPIKTGLKCTRCGRLAHKACTKLMKNVQLLSSEKMICCVDSTIPSDEAAVVQDDLMQDLDTAGDINKITIKYLEELIRQKDMTIHNQNIAIAALKDHNEYLKRHIQGTGTIAQQSKRQDKQLYSKAVAGPSGKSGTIAPATVPASASQTAPLTVPAAVQERIIIKQDVSRALQNVETRRICEKVINLESDKKEMHSRRTPRANRSILVGSGADMGTCPFRSAPLIKFNEYHVTNFEVGVTDEALGAYLKTFAPNVAVKKLVSRYPDKYASFKITVPRDEAEKLLVSEIWPSNVVLNRFFPARRPRAESA